MFGFAGLQFENLERSFREGLKWAVSTLPCPLVLYAQQEISLELGLCSGSTSRVYCTGK